LYGLRDAGYQAFVVGGAVRDVLLGLQPKDFDVATNATPEQIQRVFRRSRLVGRRFLIAHVRFGDEMIEVTTFRAAGAGAADDREVENDGRILRDNVFGSIEEDAVRRDFTVNALYYNIADYSILDYVGGLDDIAARQLRLIGEPEQRYREDPVRMLRAARLRAKLGFSFAPATLAPIAAQANDLRSIPPARLFEEVLKLFLTGHALASLNELNALGLDVVLLPALAKALRAKPEARALLELCLTNTDERFNADKPVAAGFLLAALAWPLIDQRVLLEHPSPEACNQMIEDAFSELGQFVTLPRRFTTQAREVFELQPRLQRGSASRARRLIPMPRFRAGFDFLSLRALVEPELAPWVQRWTDAQLPDADLEQIFSGRAAAPGADPAPLAAPAKKKRRRRRKSKAGKAADAPSE